MYLKKRYVTSSVLKQVSFSTILKYLIVSKQITSGTTVVKKPELLKEVSFGLGLGLIVGL